MPIPETTRHGLARRLEQHRRQHWPLIEVVLRYRTPFAYIDGVDADGDPLPLCRLRYQGSPNEWGFAIYLASRDGYEDSILPTGSFTGTPEDALDCACGLYLNY